MHSLSIAYVPHVFTRLLRLAYGPHLAVAALGAPFSPSLVARARTYRCLFARLPAM